MDKSEVKRIVDAHLPFMRWDLQLHHWEVKVFYGRLTRDDGDECVGLSQAEPEYEHVGITIDPEHCEDEDDVLRTLRHELLHVMHADFELYRRAAGVHVDHDSPAWYALEVLFTAAAERTRLRIERMMDHGYQLPLGRRPDYVGPVVNPYEGDGSIGIVEKKIERA